jgi:hypothetical protein
MEESLPQHSMIDKRTLTLIFAAIRNSFKRSEIYTNCLLRSSIKSGPRGGLRIYCSKCQNQFLPREIEVNHEPPVCEYEKYWYEYSVEEYYSRVFVETISPLCKPCHKSLTKNQNILRKLAKNK